MIACVAVPLKLSCISATRGAGRGEEAAALRYVARSARVDDLFPQLGMTETRCTVVAGVVKEGYLVAVRCEPGPLELISKPELLESMVLTVDEVGYGVWKVSGLSGQGNCVAPQLISHSFDMVGPPRH
jgi:hypothetical protein